MLKLSSDSEVTLNQSQFRHYMQDDWDWQKSLNVTKSKYGVV